VPALRWGCRQEGHHSQGHRRSGPTGAVPSGNHSPERPRSGHWCSRRRQPTAGSTPVDYAGSQTG
jgi:hypothetical protein